jgi:surface antigen
MNDRDDDRPLSEYLDGALGAAERNALKARLAAEPALAARLEAFRVADRAARDWSEAALADPSPGAVAIIRRRRPARRRQSAPWLVPAAAAVALVVLGGFGVDRLVDWRVTEALDREHAERAADMELLAHAMQVTMETQESDTPVTFRSDETGFQVTLVARRTWRSKSGHWCRQFVELFPGTAPEAAPVSIACRTHHGKWLRMKTELNYPAEPPMPDLVPKERDGAAL